MGTPILLAVDDDVPVLAAVERDLRSRYQPHYAVMTASSGPQALDLLRRLRLRDDAVALLLVDQRMPEMAGTELLAASRRLYPDARRVLLTAYADTDAAIRAINDADVHHYLLKPWDPPEERLYPFLDDLLQTWRRPPPVANLRLLGDRWSPASHALRAFLTRNLVPYRWLDVQGDPQARELLELAGLDGGALPAVVLDDGEVLVQPELPQLASRIGLRSRAERAAYDLVVVGAGPAGLAAGVYGASEGMSTLVTECNAPGGQAGTTSRIENYLGFPVGLSGADLTLRAREQAVRLGAELLVPAEVTGLRRADPYTVVRLADGTEISASALVVATGVEYRTLDVPGAAGLAGAGLYYGAGRPEALDHAGGRVFVVGAGNSAGQAAVFLSQFAASVTLLVRGSSLGATMSAYLVDQIAALDRVTVEHGTEVAGVLGGRRVEGLRLRTGSEEREVAADALFVFIGQAPRTAWLDGVVRRDERGFVLTGTDLGTPPPDWPLAVPPLPLETAVPGVFAAGDVRHGSMKRIASAVGEGAMSVRFAHEHLARA
ncbi:response regulator [Blastococcus sp. MG754426]|uniref:FAD-dependent oxidoreductase n=1 Tax=unclassified Blastococcus TaxID=2619396 RepID=UPI001EF028B7|nr:MULTISPECIES: FAD-dependent oxidoreductase [unclassified Blastococcus]MCF6508241.1 response regulator [Blastococcus sp. MG754426]MCF6512132.1 response regulator [Blastococcus sp. MG754427]